MSYTQALHKCSVRGIYWEQIDRYADDISGIQSEEARKTLRQDSQLFTIYPADDLEIVLEKIRSGTPPCLTLQSDVAVPSGDEIRADGSGFQPLLRVKTRVKMMACFTAKERMEALLA